MADIGIVGNQPKQPKQPKQPAPTEMIDKEFNKEDVMRDLGTNKALILANKSNYQSIVRIAATYNLTDKDFRAKCSEDKDLMNRLTIYNALILEKLMLDAIKTGKMNTQTDAYLRDEMQAYTNTGTEQNIHWIIYDKEEDIEVKKLSRKDKAVFEDKIDIVPDVDIVLNQKHETIFDQMEKIDEDNKGQ